MKSNILIIKPKSEAMVADYPTEKRIVEKIVYPENGGILSYFFNHKFPEKQLVYPEMFVGLNIFKRSLMNSIHLLKQSHLIKLLLILILPFRKLKQRIIESYVNMFWAGLNLVALKPNYYCDAGRELRRVLITLTNNPSYLTLIEMGLLFFEYDNAYRYRIQDFAGIINKNLFLNNPTEELKHSIKEYKKREFILEEKVNLFKYIYLLFYIPKYKNLAKQFIRELDLERVKLSTEDRYWCYHRLDYDFDGLELLARMDKRKEWMGLKVLSVK